MKTVIVIGAGSRGTTYSTIAKAMGDDFRVVAVAEPVDAKRNNIRDMYGVPEHMCHMSWEELLARPKFADLCIIATMDRQHYAPAMAAIEKGYDILLEKPMSATAEECCEIERAAQKTGVMVLVCHVLRYTPFFNALKNVIDSGAVGEIVHVQHAECVGNIHQSHSFVRGNWRNSEESSCMILQKSCHDMDILAYLIGKRCTRVQSFGSLTYFRPENAPEGAPLRCSDGCPHAETCCYNAERIYRRFNKHNSVFVSVVTGTPERVTDEELCEILKTSPYGRCVFHCDNNVVDHQTVNLEYEGGATASFTMCAFNKGGRYMRIFGTKGEITANMDDDHFTLYEFSTQKSREISISDAMINDTIDGGHGGGDDGIMHALSKKLHGETVELCSLEETCRNHLIAFAAEESRVTGRVIDMAEYEKKFGGLI